MPTKVKRSRIIRTPIALLINEQAATHSKLMKELGLYPHKYYAKLRGDKEFTDEELRTIADHSTCTYEGLKRAVRKG